MEQVKLCNFSKFFIKLMKITKKYYYKYFEAVSCNYGNILKLKPAILSKIAKIYLSIYEHSYTTYPDEINTGSIYCDTCKKN